MLPVCKHQSRRGEHPFQLIRRQHGGASILVGPMPAGEGPQPHKLLGGASSSAEGASNYSGLELSGQGPKPRGRRWCRECHRQRSRPGVGADPHLVEEVEAVQAPTILGAAVVVDVDKDGAVGEVVRVGDEEDKALILDGVEVLGPGDGKGSTVAKEADEGAGTRTLPRKLHPFRLQSSQSRDRCRRRCRWCGRGRSSRSTTGRRGARLRWVELKLDLGEC
jgi:hypothetical protein